MRNAGFGDEEIAKVVSIAYLSDVVCTMYPVTLDKNINFDKYCILYLSSIHSKETCCPCYMEKVICVLFLQSHNFICFVFLTLGEACQINAHCAWRSASNSRLDFALWKGISCQIDNYDFALFVHAQCSAPLRRILLEWEGKVAEAGLDVSPGSVAHVSRTCRTVSYHFSHVVKQEKRKEIFQLLHCYNNVCENKYTWSFSPYVMTSIDIKNSEMAQTNPLSLDHLKINGNVGDDHLAMAPCRPKNYHPNNGKFIEVAFDHEFDHKKSRLKSNRLTANDRRNIS